MANVTDCDYGKANFWYACKYLPYPWHKMCISMLLQFLSFAMLAEVLREKPTRRIDLAYIGRFFGDLFWELGNRFANFVVV